MSVDPRNFLLNSDYPIDKVSGSHTGSVTVAATTSGSKTVAHGLSYAPLYFVKWSTNSNFSTSFDELGVSTVNNLLFTAMTDGTNIYLFYDNNTGSQVTFYYRIIYFMPTNVNVSATETQSVLDNYVLNTDYNYTKIFAEDYVASTGSTIDHDLGYYPQVEAWYERTSDSRIVHCIDSNVNTSTPTQPRVKITTTQIILEEGSGTSVDAWHYKIYADEL